MRLGRWELRWGAVGLPLEWDDYGKMTSENWTLWWFGPLELWRYDV